MTDLVNHWADLWWSWMGPMFWQLALLVLVFAVVDLALRRWAWPQLRYAVWLIVLVKLIAGPWLASPVSITSPLTDWARQRVSITVDGEPPASVPVAIRAAPSPAIVTPLPIAAQPTIGPPATFSWQSYIMLTWLLGVVALAVWLGKRYRTLQRYSHDATALPELIQTCLTRAAGNVGLRRLPRICLANNIATPAVFGLVRPILLLPADGWDQWSRSELLHILMHECAHIKRRDLLVHAVQVVLQIVYWFNPLVWLLGRRLHHLRELCCDATVARQLREEAGAYRQTLLETARRLLARRVEPGLGLLGLFENVSQLKSRLSHLERPISRYRRAQLILASVVAIMLFICVIPMVRADKPANNADAPHVAVTPASDPCDVSASSAEGWPVYSAQRLKQIGLALAMHQADHDGEFPPSLEPLQPYLDNEELFNWALENVAYPIAPLQVVASDATYAIPLPLACDKALLGRLGHTAVAFSDGHVELLSADNIERLAPNRQAYRRALGYDPCDTKRPSSASELIESAQKLDQISKAFAVFMNDNSRLPYSLEPLRSYLKDEELFTWAQENLAYPIHPLPQPLPDAASARAAPITYDKTLLARLGHTNALLSNWRVQRIAADEVMRLTTARRAYIPDADSQGVDAVLDLGSGAMLPTGGSGEQIVGVFTKLGKGDLAYDRLLICLRGGTAIGWDGESSRPLQIGGQIQDATAYELPSLPCRIVVTTGDDERYEVSILSTFEGGINIAYHRIADAPGRIRHFVRLVVGREEMTFQGELVTWDQLPQRLQKIPHRQQTVLECALASEQMTLADKNEATARAGQFARQFNFEYPSYIGIHPLGSEGTGSQVLPPEAPVKRTPFNASTTTE